MKECGTKIRSDVGDLASNIKRNEEEEKIEKRREEREKGDVLKELSEPRMA